MSDPFDYHAHRPIVTDAELHTLPEGLYRVAGADGDVARRTGSTAQLLARVRRTWGRMPGRVHKVYMRKDGLQVVWQWEDQMGTWPEDDPHPPPPAYPADPPDDDRWTPEEADE